MLFSPLVPCVLRQHLWLKRKYFTEVNASTGTFALVCFLCRLTRAKAACGLPGREEYPREVTSDALSDSVGAAQASFAVVQVVMNHLARAERRSKLGRR